METKNGDIKIIKETKDNNIRNISLSIPIIKDNETSKIISAEYYLKIYQFSDKDLFINNTISIIDNLDPYKIIEFTTNETEYNNTITVPNDKNKYYMRVNAITNERELLSYNSFIIDINNEKDGGQKEESKGGLEWYYILLIILAILILLVIIIFSIRYAMKKRENKIEVVEQMIPLTTENKL